MKINKTITVPQVNGLLNATGKGPVMLNKVTGNNEAWKM